MLNLILLLHHLFAAVRDSRRFVLHLVDDDYCWERSLARRQGKVSRDQSPGAFELDCFDLHAPPFIGLRMADGGLGIVDFGFRIGEEYPFPSLRNPKSKMLTADG